MSRQISFISAAAIAAASTLFIPARLNAQTPELELSAKDADACIVKLDQGKNLFSDHPVAEEGDVFCYKSRPAGICSLESKSGNDHLPLMRLGEEGFLQFRSASDDLVDINLDGSGSFEKLEIISGPTNSKKYHVIYHKPIDPKKISELSPGDRQTIKNWFEYGESKSCSKLTS